MNGPQLKERRAAKKFYLKHIADMLEDGADFVAIEHVKKHYLRTWIMPFMGGMKPAGKTVDPFMEGKSA